VCFSIRGPLSGSSKEWTLERGGESASRRISKSASQQGGGEWTLPDGWVWTTIGGVAETTSGGTPSRKRPEYYTDGTVPWVKSGELRDRIICEVEESITEDALNSSSAKVFPKGTPVVALYGATVGRTGILGIDAATNQAVCAVFALESAFTAKFILYWLQHQRANLIELSSGGAQPNISQRIVRAFPFPLAPLPEQHRIVAEIETQFTRLDAAVAALKRAQANLRRYKAAVLKAACEGRLVPTEAELARAEGRDYEPADVLLQRILAERRARWEEEHPRKRYTEPASPDTEDLLKLPEGWVWVTLQELSWDSNYGTSQKCTYEAEGPPVLRIPNIVSGTVDLDNLKHATDPEGLARKDVLVPGDLLIVRTNGSRSLIGRTALIRSAFDRPHFFASYLIRFRILEVQNWLATIWDVPIIREWLERAAATSAGQYNLSIRTLNRLPIPLAPLPEQHRIVAEVERRLSVVAALETSVEAALARAARLRQSILKCAFEGRLVPQDPDDEPASVLLARIRATRETRGTGEKKRKTQQMRLPAV
jgi:type I restriction enzyme S subunit